MLHKNLIIIIALSVISSPLMGMKASCDECKVYYDALENGHCACLTKLLQDNPIQSIAKEPQLPIPSQFILSSEQRACFELMIARGAKVHHGSNATSLSIIFRTVHGLFWSLTFHFKK